MKALNGISKPVYLFDDDEKKSIEKNLLQDGFPEKKISLFILDAQTLCGSILMNFHGQTPTFYERPSRTEYKLQFTDMQRRFEKTREILEVIARETGPAWRPTYPSKLSDVFQSVEQINDIDQDPAYQANCEAVRLARVAMDALSGLEKIFADHLDDQDLGTINEEFGAKILEIYRARFGEPSASINNAFPYILKMLFKAVWIDIKAPEKLAAKLLKKFPKN